MLVGMVDVIFADVAQPDQARIVGLNAHLFLKVDGGILVSVKANCIDSTAKPEVVFANEVKKMREERIKPKEQLTLGKSRDFRGRGRENVLTNLHRTFRARPLHRCWCIQAIGLGYHSLWTQSRRRQVNAWSAWIV